MIIYIVNLSLGSSNGKHGIIWREGDESVDLIEACCHFVIHFDEMIFERVVMN